MVRRGVEVGDVKCGNLPGCFEGDMQGKDRRGSQMVLFGDFQVEVQMVMPKMEVSVQKLHKVPMVECRGQSD